jgi:serine/threonine protein kinase/tetratricopeptide (TPR) repeat protein
MTGPRDITDPLPLAGIAGTRASAGSDAIVGRRVGPYLVVAEVGRGGMGAVYRAVRDDDQYKKEVALKLVQAGADSQETLERFKRERQMLAGLDHPNIARLLDGGATEDGRPYFVMELVDGEPIDRYCERVGLEVRRRLELFRSVCSAVQYAHQNLIVHRDIKPGNILVTKDGVPKLLDFGIAKLLRAGDLAAGDATVTQSRALTPFYASPEQVKGEPITTASDVYSLGVLLYELLAGRRPYALTNPTQNDVFRAICEQEPAKPSTAARSGPGGSTSLPATAGDEPTEDLVSRTATSGAATQTAPVSAEVAVARYSREIRGDLDTIVLMALRKEPARRYSSVEQFSEDIRRHLEGLPVRARKDTLSYRTEKFVSRNRVAVAAAGLLALSLVGGIVATIHQARIAEAQRARAERRFTDVRALAHSLLFEIHDGIENLAGATKVRELLVRRGVEYLDSLSREAAGDASLQAELAEAYERVGGVQWSLGRASLGDTAGALASQQKSLAIRTALAGASPRDDKAQRALAMAFCRVGDALRALGNADQALESYKRALAIPEALAGPGADPEWLDTLASAYNHAALGLTAKGDASGALALARNGLAVSERLVATRPDLPGARRSLIVAHNTLARLLENTGKNDEALPVYESAVVLAEAQAKARPDDAQARRDVSTAYTDNATNLRRRGELDKALALYRKAVAIDEALAAADPSNVEAKRDLGISNNKVAITLAAKKEWAGALVAQRRALALQQAVVDANPESAQVQEDLADGYYHLAEIAKGRGDLQGAVESHRRAVQIEERISATDPGNAEIRDRLGESYINLADALMALVKPEEAIPLIDRAIAIGEALAKADADNPARQAVVAQAYGRLGAAWNGSAPTKAGAGRIEALHKAREAYEHSLALWRPLEAKGLLETDDKAEVARTEAGLARCDAALKR